MEKVVTMVAALVARAVAVKAEAREAVAAATGRLLAAQATPHRHPPRRETMVEPPTIPYLDLAQAAAAALVLLAALGHQPLAETAARAPRRQSRDLL